MIPKLKKIILKSKNQYNYNKKVKFHLINMLVKLERQNNCLNTNKIKKMPKKNLKIGKENKQFQM